jgi:DNA replication and repair protein RecF
MPLSVKRLSLTRFRSYETLRLDTEGAAKVVLTGENGSGKTNVLEAVSLLAPGRGLRGAELLEMQQRGAEEPWAVAAEIETPQGLSMRVGTGLAPRAADSARARGEETQPRRVTRLNGRDLKSQQELASIVSSVWLTPQMDRLFLESASPRRRFLDRLVHASAPDHGLFVNRAEKHLRERMKLLHMDRPDPRWLDSVEAQIAADSVAVAAARADFLARLRAHAATLKAMESLFPVPDLSIEGWAEAAVGQMPALALEEEIKLKLARNRASDAGAGRTEGSVLRSDLKAFYAEKQMPAAQCSTGEQKGMLIAIVLAHAFMMQAEKGFVPLILLDEVVAHLDDARRAQLFSFLSGVNGQIWLTGTDAGAFRALDDARFFGVEGGAVREAA